MFWCVIYVDRLNKRYDLQHSSTYCALQRDHDTRRRRPTLDRSVLSSSYRPLSLWRRLPSTMMRGRYTGGRWTGQTWWCYGGWSSTIRHFARWATTYSYPKKWWLRLPNLNHTVSLGGCSLETPHATSLHSMSFPASSGLLPKNHPVSLPLGCIRVLVMTFFIRVGRGTV